jgi:hypothetical protein
MKLMSFEAIFILRVQEYICRYIIHKVEEKASRENSVNALC